MCIESWVSSLHNLAEERWGGIVFNSLHMEEMYDIISMLAPV